MPTCQRQLDALGDREMDIAAKRKALQRFGRGAKAKKSFRKRGDFAYSRGSGKEEDGRMSVLLPELREILTAPSESHHRQLARQNFA